MLLKAAVGVGDMRRERRAIARYNAIKRKRKVNRKSYKARIDYYVGRRVMRSLDRALR